MSSSNSNCLANVRCPKCQALEPFSIVSKCMATWTDDGTTDTTDFEFDTHARCTCLSCGHAALVDDFMITS